MQPKRVVERRDEGGGHEPDRLPQPFVCDRPYLFGLCLRVEP